MRNQAEISCNAGQVWRNMGEAERLPYIQRAQEEKKKHTLQYPDYVPGMKGVARKKKTSARRSNPKSSQVSTSPSPHKTSAAPTPAPVERSPLTTESCAWDSWLYAPLEMYEYPCDLIEVPEDFGFYHPWELGGSLVDIPRDALSRLGDNE
ncbi:hypothetical protein B0H14DRAFT_2940291 [Mycena olivaceomarginata]|nr:hypothetical protein B0H14DRAFT_2940291 [Mycena olivaceomarginata]